MTKEKCEKTLIRGGAIAKQRIFLWDNIKFILMFFVVVTHCMCVYIESGNKGEWCQYLWIFTLTFTMPSFMIASGFFYKKREIRYLFKNYMWPCIIFSIVNFIIGYIVKYPMYYDVSLLSIIKQLPAMYAMWYLWALFIYGIITPILKKYLNTKQILLLAVFILFFASFWSTQTFKISRLLGFYPYYILGILLGEHKDLIYKLNTSYKLYSILTLFTCLGLYFVMNMIIPEIAISSDSGTPQLFSLRGIAIKSFTYLINPILSIAFICSVPNKELSISKLGAKTMYCYYWHMVPIFLMGWYICSSFRCEWYGYILLMIITPLSTLLFYTNMCKKITDKVLLK